MMDKGIFLAINYVCIDISLISKILINTKLTPVVCVEYGSAGWTSGNFFFETMAG